jgi:predicted enzyme related to lactoylglutathione lyase
MDRTIVHFEIPANDVERLRKFYTELFGWKIEKAEGMDYWLVQTVPVDAQNRPTRQGVNGGLSKRQMPDQKATNYIAVQSVDEASAKVAQLGGRIVVPKQEVPNMGSFAVAIDPEGNAFGIWEERSM